MLELQQRGMREVQKQRKFTICLVISLGKFVMKKVTEEWIGKNRTNFIILLTSLFRVLPNYNIAVELG